MIDCDNILSEEFYFGDDFLCVSYRTLNMQKSDQNTAASFLGAHEFVI